MKRVPKFPMPGIYILPVSIIIISGRYEALEQAELTVKNISEAAFMISLPEDIAGIPPTGIGLFLISKNALRQCQFISLLSDFIVSHGTGIIYCQRLNHRFSFHGKWLGLKEGGYLQSIDADSEGEEGKYLCLWKKEEIDEIAGENQNIIFGLLWDQR